MNNDRERIIAFNALTEKIIGCAINVHKELGPGLLEALYRDALAIEFDYQGLEYKRELMVPVLYRNRLIGQYRLDLLVEDTVILELKAVTRDDPVFTAQLLTYLRVTKRNIGLLINFNKDLLKNGISRILL